MHRAGTIAQTLKRALSITDVLFLLFSISPFFLCRTAKEQAGNTRLPRKTQY